MDEGETCVRRFFSMAWEDITNVWRRTPSDTESLPSNVEPLVGQSGAARDGEEAPVDDPGLSSTDDSECPNKSLRSP